MDQVRVEGSVLLAFDRCGIMKLEQFVGNAPRFLVCVDAGLLRNRKRVRGYPHVALVPRVHAI